MAANGWARKNTSTPAVAARRAKYNSAEHRAARKHYAAWIAAGKGQCWRCLGHIPPGSDWHVGHDDLDVTLIRGAEHAGCNKRAAASKGARIANAKRKVRELGTTRLSW
jgi:hypothetical protein